MSNITLLFNEKCFVLDGKSNITDSKKELINLIFEKHGEKKIISYSQIDENDFYDSFLIETEKFKFCVKISFEKEDLFYDYFLITGIKSLNITPISVTKGEIEYGKLIYYTIQTYEDLDNLYSISNHEIVNNKFIFSHSLKLLNSLELPIEICNKLHTFESILNRNFNNFKFLFKELNDNSDSFLKMNNIYNELYLELLELIKNNSFNKEKKVLHGNLNHKTILTNKNTIKYINFENCFLGNSFFDIINLIFELQIVGLNEHSFLLNNTIKNVDNNLNEIIFEYKTCKNIWAHKKLLDLIFDFCKQIYIKKSNLNFKYLNTTNNFSKYFYRFANIKSFNNNKDFLVDQFVNNIPR